MKTSSKHTGYLLALLFLVTVSFSCQKYEDGPLLSLRSKKDRISNVWRVQKAVEDGIDRTIEQYFTVISMNKNGKCNVVQYFEMTSGTWEFIEHKSKLHMEYENGTTEDWEILRLTEKEMTIRITDQGHVAVYELVAK